MIAVRSKGVSTPKNLAELVKHYKDLASDIEKQLKSGGVLAWKGNKYQNAFNARYELQLFNLIVRADTYS